MWVAVVACMAVLGAFGALCAYAYLADPLCAAVRRVAQCAMAGRPAPQLAPTTAAPQLPTVVLRKRAVGC